MVQTEPSPHDLAELIAALAEPAAYPHPVDAVEVVQTHISVVFLAGDLVYKLKKPLDLGFLDYSTLARRQACCEAEVALNRRLAGDVYLRVAPITRAGDGALRVDGAGAPVEYAVVMRRLPAERTFKALLAQGELDAAAVERLATRLAAFHQDAARGAAVARFGGFDVVAGNCRENFSQLEPFVGRTISPTVYARLERATEAELARHRELIEARAAAGVPCDSHGDLRLEHVYLLGDAPQDLIVVDCIEFNERFRYGDPIADLAFLVMELRKEQRADLADALVDAYLAAADDAAGRALLPLYTAYRATVRGKVHGFALGEEELPAAARERARDRARGDLLFADALLRPPGERPCLVLVGGLPCTGKSTVAEALARDAGCEWLRSDVIRKELAGLTPTTSAAATFEAGIYTPEWSRQTYAACLERAEQALFEGRRVVVDACFASHADRERFRGLARRWEVPFLLLRCDLTPDEVQRRVAARARGEAGPSDADWEVYQRMRGRWQPLPPDWGGVERVIATGGPPGASGRAALAALEAAGLLDA